LIKSGRWWLADIEGGVEIRAGIMGRNNGVENEKLRDK
jgi:hypothetical protein